MSSSVPQSAAVYYRDKYWNDHPYTHAYNRRRFDGIKGVRSWGEYFLAEYLNNTPVDKALFLNCGNGWVERELYDLGLFRSAVSFDYSQELLVQAKELAEARPIDYFQCDCNKVDFEENQFDLVINYAAMHHVQWIDRLNRIIAKTLKEDGYFVNCDYVGAHRNQYGKAHFSRMQAVNGILKGDLRAEPFVHPDLAGMIHCDPTEAIHSELIFKMFYRYFYPLERKDMYGGIA